jgi:hypothetical protein
MPHSTNEKANRIERSNTKEKSKRSNIKNRSLEVKGLIRDRQEFEANNSLMKATFQTDDSLLLTIDDFSVRIPNPEAYTYEWILLARIVPCENRYTLGFEDVDIFREGSYVHFSLKRERKRVKFIEIACCKALYYVFNHIMNMHDNILIVGDQEYHKLEIFKDILDDRIFSEDRLVIVNDGIRYFYFNRIEVYKRHKIGLKYIKFAEAIAFGNEDFHKGLLDEIYFKPWK